MHTERHATHRHGRKRFEKRARESIDREPRGLKFALYTATGVGGGGGRKDETRETDATDDASARNLLIHRAHTRWKNRRHHARTNARRSPGHPGGRISTGRQLRGCPEANTSLRVLNISRDILSSGNESSEKQQAFASTKFFHDSEVFKSLRISAKSPRPSVATTEGVSSAS